MTDPEHANGRSDEAPAAETISQPERESLSGRTMFDAAQAERAALASLKLPVRSAEQFIREVPPEPDWLIPGLLGRGWCVKVAGREKTAGKGTLEMHLIAAMEKGAETVFGPSGQATTMIYSEEPEDAMREKLTKFNVQRASILLSWELPTEVAAMGPAERWPTLCRMLCETAIDKGHKVLFIDNISRACGAEDESGMELTRKIEVLMEQVRRHGLTLLFDHHHRKAAGDVHDLSRGGTGAAGATDNNIEVQRPKGGKPGRRDRLITSYGKMMATQWTKTIERIDTEDDGFAYRLLDTPPEGESASSDDAAETGLDATRLRQLGDLCLAQPDGVTAEQFARVIQKKGGTARDWLNDKANIDVVQRIEGRPVLYLRWPKV